MIHFVIEEAIDAGFNNIAIITRKGKTVIEDYIDSMDFKADICYLRQNEPKGFGDAILRARNFVGTDSFGVLVGDEIFEGGYPPMHALQNVHYCNNRKKSVISVQPNTINPEKYANVYHKWRNCDEEDLVFNVSAIIEKPTSNFAEHTATGRYILTSTIFKYLEKAQPTINGEVQLTDSISSLIWEEGVSAVEFEGNRFDVGTPEGYINYIKKL